MPGDPRRRFDLVFAGEILPGTSPADAREALAAFFQISDPAGVEIFFRGRELPLRRDLEQRDAARLFREMRSAGLLCELRPRESTPEPTPPTPETPASPEPAARPQPQAAATKASARRKIGALRELLSQPLRQLRWPRLVRRKMPQRQTSEKSQDGEDPNLFSLRPAPRSRATGDALLLSTLSNIATAAMILLLLIALQLRFPPPQLTAPAAISDAAAAADGRLFLLLGDRLLVHGRSGRGLFSVDAKALGLASLQPPLALDAAGWVLVAGRRAPSSAPRLWRCDLAAQACQAATKTPVDAVAVVGDALGDRLFLRSRAGELLRVTAQGDIEASAALPLSPGQSPLLNVDGLLLAPVADASLIGVYRSDAANFGTQVDGLLPLPVPAVASPAIIDIAAADDGYWVLFDSEAGQSLTRFDRRWQSQLGTRLASPAKFAVSWGAGAIFDGGDRAAIPRFGNDGQALKPLRSELVAKQEQQWDAQRGRARWRHAGNLVALFLTALALLRGGLQWLAYRFHRSVNAPSVALNPQERSVDWLPLSSAAAAARRGCAAGLLAIPPVAMFFVDTATRASFLLPALVGALLALRFLWPSPGHIGVLGNAVLAVDWRRHYSMHPRQALRGGRHWLLVDSVAVPIALPGLRHMDRETVAAAGLNRIPRCKAKEVLARLWTVRQPWLLAALSVGAGWLLSVMLLMGLP